VIGLRSGGPRAARVFSHSTFAARVSAGPRAPSEARHGVAEHLQDLVDPGVLETVKLLISETVTNCVTHARVGDEGNIVVTLSLLPWAVHAEVSTAGPGFHVAQPEPARLTDEHGRGLQIVELLAERWGIRPESNSVWFEVAADG
jgi:anti-sigma regulatory factor (Ser/Thr protein kinase)